VRLAPQLGDELDGAPVHRRERRGVVAELLAPVGVRPPGGSVEHEGQPAVARQVEERLKVAPQLGAPLLRLDEREGREARQIHAMAEDQRGLHAGVGERQRSRQAPGGHPAII
jgi:hypothetical protein